MADSLEGRDGMTLTDMLVVVRMAAREQGLDALATLLNRLMIMASLDQAEVDGRSDRIQSVLDSLPAKWKPIDDMN